MDFIFPLRRYTRLATHVFLLIGFSATGWAQNKALDLSQNKNVNVPPQIREDLQTIGRYADTVSRQLNVNAPAQPAAATAPVPESDAPSPRQDGGDRRRFDTLVDPFEVSPQLRENRRGGNGFRGLPSASKLDIRRRIKIKAMLVTPRGRAAQLEIDGQRSHGGARGKGGPADDDVLTVMDGEVVDFGDLGIYVVNVSAHEGVTLATPGNSQSGRISLR